MLVKIYLLDCKKSVCQRTLANIISSQIIISFQNHEIRQDNLKKLEVKRPESVTQLHLFLVQVQFNGKSNPNLSMEAHPLDKLLEETRKWKWLID